MTMKALLNILKKYSPILGVILFICIIITIDIDRLFSIVRTSDLMYIVVCVLLAPIIIFMLALRWQLILRALKIKYRFIYTCRSLMKGALMGEITPGKLGELIRARFLSSETSCSPGKALFSVIIDRIYDLFILTILVVISSLVLMRNYAIDLPLTIIITLSAVFCISLAIFMNENTSRLILSPVFRFLIPDNYKSAAGLHFSEFYNGIKSMNKNTHAKCLALSIAIWLLKLSAIFVLSKALGIEIPFWFVLCSGSIVVIVSLLPISVSGIGTREAIFIFFLSFYDISAVFAVALSFLYFMFGILSVTASGGIVYLYEMGTSLLKRA